MSSRWLRLSLGVVSCLSFALAACERPSDITAPGSTPTIAAPQYSNGPNIGGDKFFQDLNRVVVSASVHESTICRIGREGGICSTASGASIFVPANTVSNSTYFQVKLNVGPYVTVSLAASSKPCSLICGDDVGSAGFKKSIVLNVPKFGAKPQEGGSIVIAAKDPSGSRIVPTTTIDLGSSVAAEITHFSDYDLRDR